MDKYCKKERKKERNISIYVKTNSQVDRSVTQSIGTKYMYENKHGWSAHYLKY